MKNYVEQFYNEGFATTFYLKPIKFINNKINNKKIVNVISIFIKILYTIIMILVAAWMFYMKWPL